MSVDHSVLRGLKMRRDPLAARAVALARLSPFRETVLSWVARREGGQLTSRTLRAYLRGARDVTVGDYSYGSLLEPGRADAGLEIGRYVSIGPDVRRFGAAHPVDRLSMHPYWYNPAFQVVDSSSDVVRTRCVIGHEAWIGANVTILPGCERVGIGAVVGAGTIVTKDIPDFAIVVGNPGRVRGFRLSEEIRATLLREEPWLFEPDEAAAILKEIADRHNNGALFV